MNKERKIAIDEGKRVYMGSPCINEHNGKRYTRNGECTFCRNEYLKRKRRERGLKCPGRPRLDEKKEYARRWPKYPDPKTDFDFWILRIKRANKERRLLSYEEYVSIFNKKCPLLGIDLDFRLFKGKVVPDNYATLDKIYPSQGYVSGNLQILSHRANTLKNNSSIEELKRLVENWEKMLFLEKL